MKHQTITIRNANGKDVLAQTPLIISASRATDIPAFYAEWFFHRLEKGFVRWRNPFSGHDNYVLFDNTCFIVFWSKNPAPLLSHLSMLKERGIGCYIQFTLNDYESEGLEPKVPTLTQRIEWDKETMREFASLLSAMNRNNWNFRLATCAERIDLSEYGIEHNRH